MVLILALAASGLGLLLALWAIQRRTKNAATVDVGWSILVAGGAVAAGFLTDADPWRRTLVAGMAAVWALRLGTYLLLDRVLTDTGEDGRYRALREQWGERAQRNFLLLYLGQAGVAALFITPIAAAMRGGPLDGWAATGVAVGLAAVVGESVADRQLARFRAEPANRGAVCRAGLWRYSRHPNYFFEWVHWWAYVLIGHAAPLTLLGPAVMLLFLFRITGIPYVERQALRSRGEAYRSYQRTTSMFVPWPPRRGAP
jgi:steroid 5-alpha reductase family enzyme